MKLKLKLTRSEGGVVSREVERKSNKRGPSLCPLEPQPSERVKLHFYFASLLFVLVLSHQPTVERSLRKYSKTPIVSRYETNTKIHTFIIAISMTLLNDFLPTILSIFGVARVQRDVYITTIIMN